MRDHTQQWMVYIEAQLPYEHIYAKVFVEQNNISKL